MSDPVLGRLAGITALSVHGRGPTQAFVFDPHRLAFPCWALAAQGGPVAVLTLDRHFDLVPPKVTAPPGASVLELDRFAREQLDVRNVDHVLAAIDAGLVTDVVAVARAQPSGCFEGTEWKGRQLIRARTLDALTADFDSPRASDASRRAAQSFAQAERIVLDIDLDCFTSPNDADPTSVVPWPEAVIREFLFPPGHEAFWGAVLPKCVAMTLAREPAHCGGLVATGRLFEVAASVVFRELLRADVP